MRSLHCILLPMVIGLSLASCASSSASPEDPKPEPSTVVGLARAFTFFETRGLNQPAEALRDKRVDYDSEITVRPDLAKLKHVAESSGTASVATATPATTLENLLQPTLSAIQTYVGRASLYSAAVRGDARILSDDLAWRSVAESELAMDRALIDVSSAITAYEFDLTDPNWNTKDTAELGIDEERHERMLERRAELDRRFKPDPLRDADGEPIELAEGDTIDVQEIVREVNRVLAEEARRLEALGETVRAGHDLLITAELLRGGEVYPVSVVPYSSVEGQSRGAKSQRVSMPSGADLERLEKEYAANERLAKSIEKTRDLVGDPVKFAAATKELASALDAYAKEAKERLEAKLGQAVASPPRELADVFQAAETVQARFGELASAVKVLVAGAAKFSPSELLSAASAVEGLVRGGLKTALVDLKKKLESVSMLTPPAIVGELRALVSSELKELEDALAGTAFGDSLGGLVGSLRQMRALARADGFGALKPGKVTRKPFSIDEAPDGVIQLENSPAEADDKLRITYELTPRAATDGKEAKPRTECSFLDVRKFGFYTTYGSQVLFADRIGDGSSRYQAAAGLAVNLHYRPESARSFFDVVAPGIGICVAAPSFENGVELAVGLQATVFSDTIQAGYLYDISVEDDPWAFYFGIDLIQAFRKLN